MSRHFDCQEFRVQLERGLIILIYLVQHSEDHVEKTIFLFLNYLFLLLLHDAFNCG
jgi:hypothetical protein